MVVHLFMPLPVFNLTMQCLACWSTAQMFTQRTSERKFACVLQCWKSAGMKGLRSLAGLLLRAGADETIVDAKGRTSADMIGRCVEEGDKNLGGRSC